jgi:hypothetical protein
MHKVIVSAAPGLAFIMGLFAFKSLTLFYRVIFFQVMSYLIVLYLTYSVTPENIHWIYNIYLPFEMAMLMGGGIIYFKRLKERMIMALSFLFFLIIYLIQINGSLKSFANFASVVEGVIMMVIYLIILNNQFSFSTFSLRTSPLFWLCLGSAIYFSGTIPLLSIFNFANRNFLTEHAILFNAIVDVLANIRYLFIAISFWLCFKSHSNSLKVIT